MIWIFLSAILFGLVHPGSKFLMGRGIELLPFCLLYIGIRLAIQLPLAIKSGTWRIRSRSQLFYLLSLGLVGAGLQFTEFFGISDGLPVSMVSFLVYTHPVWTLLLGRAIGKEPIGAISVLKMCFAVAGIALITNVGTSFHYSPTMLIFPLCAGIMISLWITLSNQAAKSGCSTRAISFYYDLFAFIVLLTAALFTNHGSYLGSALRFAAVPSNLLLISIYSVLIGLVPNYLFYYGSNYVPSIVAGFILLLEPVCSALISHFTWQEPIGPLFALGAILILSTNAPAKLFEPLFKLPVRRPDYSVKYFPGMLVIAALILFVSAPALGKIPSREIYVVEIVPPDPTDYIVSGEMRQISYAVDFALKTYKSTNGAKCEPSIHRIVKYGTEEELYSTVHSLAQKKGPAPVLVGLTRSNFARVAAKAAGGSDLRAISIGASASNLREINPNFSSVCSAWQRQWDAIQDKMATIKCTPENTLAVYDPKNFLSKQFGERYRSSNFKFIYEAEPTLLKTFSSVAKRKSCAFIAVNFSDAETYLNELIKEKWKGTVFGIGDWNYYSRELRKAVDAARYSGLTLYMPTGWIPAASKNSEKFNAKLADQFGEPPSPVGAYTHDALIVALDYVCHDSKTLNLDRNHLNSLPLLRVYDGVSESGNFLSKMYLLTLTTGVPNG